MEPEEAGEHVAEEHRCEPEAGWLSMERAALLAAEPVEHRSGRESIQPEAVDDSGGWSELQSGLFAGFCTAHGSFAAGPHVGG
jgi:hypothetical protein